MTGLILLGMLACGFALVPLLGGDDDEIAGPETDDDVVPGTEGDDMLTGLTGQTVNGGAGDDHLTAEEPANSVTLNGQDGNDTLTASYASDDDGYQSSDDVVLTGGTGDDDLTYFGGNATLDGGAGNDRILSENFPDGVGPSEITGGAGNDTVTVNGDGGLVAVSGGPGNDLILAGGDLEYVAGGNGDDTVIGTLPDYGQGLQLNGGAGDDFIQFDNAAGFHVRNEVDGGAGNDTITSDLLLVGPDSFHVLTGGSGADSFELRLADIGVSTDVGVVSVITDFDVAQDMLVVDPGTLFDREDFAEDEYESGFELIEAADGSHTDVAFRLTAEGGARSLAATIRLEGVTGLTEDALAFITRPAAVYDTVTATVTQA